MVVWGCICPSHILHWSSELPSYADMIYLIFCSVVWWYPGCLMNPAMREHAASDDHVVKCTKVSQHLAIFIHFAKSLSAHSHSWHGCNSSCSDISPAPQHHRTVDCIWCSEELPIFTGPRYGQRTVVLLCQCFMPSLVSCFGSRGKRTACGVSNDEVTPAFCALAATPATVDDWLCSLYDCTSSQEFVNGARKQFTQIGRAIVLRHKQYLSRTQSGLLTKPVTVGHRRWSRLRSLHLQVNGVGTRMIMTAGKYARQLFLKRHKLVVNYCAVAAIKVA